MGQWWNTDHRTQARSTPDMYLPKFLGKKAITWQKDLLQSPHTNA